MLMVLGFLNIALAAFNTAMVFHALPEHPGMALVSTICVGVNLGAGFLCLKDA